MSVITDLSVKDLTYLQQNMGNKIVVIKFSANWCKPCKIIKPTWDLWMKTNTQPNIIYAELDIDETMDLYVALKSKKMVSGIPALLMYQGNIKRDHWFIPDESFSGGDVEGFKLFINRCVLKAKNM
jgi:thiol-disulfide isomerase/thioredoxin